MLSVVLTVLIGIPIRAAAIGADDVGTLIGIPQLALFSLFIVVRTHNFSPFCDFQVYESAFLTNKPEINVIRPITAVP